MKEIKPNLFRKMMAGQPGLRFVDQSRAAISWVCWEQRAAWLKPQRPATHHSLSLHDDSATLHTLSDLHTLVSLMLLSRKSCGLKQSISFSD